MVQAGEPVSRRDLFGGMASFACPDRLQDVSEHRPVPDHQEVLTDARTDQSVIIEILVRSLCRPVGLGLEGNHS